MEKKKGRSSGFTGRPPEKEGEVIPALLVREAQAAFRRISVLEQELKKVKADYAPAEGKIIEARLRGISLQLGSPAFKVVETSRRVPRWKEMFILRLGLAEADRVIYETMPTMTRHLDFDVVGGYSPPW